MAEIKNRPFDRDAGIIGNMYRTWVQEPTGLRRSLIRVYANNSIYWSDLIRVEPLKGFCMHCLGPALKRLQDGRYECADCLTCYHIVEEL